MIHKLAESLLGTEYGGKAAMAFFVLSSELLQLLSKRCRIEFRPGKIILVVLTYISHGLSVRLPICSGLTVKFHRPNSEVS